MIKPIYFKNLNALRFIAAYFVIIHHVEQFKSLFGIKNYWSVPFIHEVGGLGVTLFFVLSGFLITYLLLMEKKETQTISIKDFYIRRILRIWPLYYLIILLGFLILPYFNLFTIPNQINWLHHYFGTRLLLFLIFLPNLAIEIFSPIPFVSQSWSVGVEEQFYLVWPILVKKVGKTLLMLYAVILFYLFLKFSLIHFSIKLSQFPVLKVISSVWDSFRIDCMALGGISAFLLFNKREKYLQIFYNKYLQLFIYALTFILISTGFQFPFINHEIYAVLFSFIILNLAGNPKSIINLEFKVLNYLGKISYGLYMYHGLCVVISIKSCLYLGVQNNLFLLICCSLLSILIASLSYEFIEKRFVVLKKRYSIVFSSNDNLINK